MFEILSSLRSLMASHSPPLDALVVPSEDYHQSEYVSGKDKRREFLSGFTGSAGLALITKNEARPYTANRWRKSFAKKDQNLIPTTTDLVDQVWKNRPASEMNQVVVHPLEFAGVSVSEKLDDLRAKLKLESSRGLVITALDEVAWLYNIRGTDVAYCPVVHAFAIVTTDFAFLYVDKKKVFDEASAYFIGLRVEVPEYTDVISDVALLALDKLYSSFESKVGQPDATNDMEIDSDQAGRLWVDPALCCYALYSKLDADKVLLQPSPLSLPKALKLEGLKKAHVRDGATVVQYLVWLDKQELYGASGYFSEAETERKRPTETSKLTELIVSDKLESLRAAKERFKFSYNIIRWFKRSDYSLFTRGRSLCRDGPRHNLLM